MNNGFLDRVVIPPVSDEESRPLWSVMIPTYNCADYLRETLAGVLAQDPGAGLMQIEVIDDYSTQDDPKSVVEEFGGRVSFYQQPENVGYLNNFDTCLQRSRGKLVHILHGDDGVLPGFYRKLQLAFEQQPDIGAAVCRHVYIDEHGHWQFISPLEEPQSQIYSNWIEQIAIKHHIQPPSIVVRRAVYEQLGGFDHRICCACEDWEMWTRIAANYPIWYEVEPLALYRKQSGSLTSRCMRTGQNFRDYGTVIRIIHDYLPEEHADRATRRALERNARCTIDIANSFLHDGDFRTALLQLSGAFQLSTSPKVLYDAIRFLLRFPLHLRSRISTRQLSS